MSKTLFGDSDSEGEKTSQLKINKTLFEDSDSEDEKTSKLKINKQYAENYDTWRRKEDFQKLKDKYGDEVLDTSESESATDSEEGLAEADNPEFDMDFFRTLAALRSKHSILNEKEQFFKDKYERTKKPREKKMTVTDLERKIVYERGGAYEDENEFKGNKEDEIKIGQLSGSFKFDDNLSDSEEGELFTKPIGNKKENVPGQNEAVQFLKGEKRDLPDKTDTELFSNLKKEWETKMDHGDKVLMDYFVNQRYLDDEEDEEVGSDPHYRAIDVEPLEEDERTFDRMEQFETKYRFRYEEPDAEFIQQYPRNLKDTVRQADTSRTEKRSLKKKQLEEEKERKKQEIERLKAFKRKEILERIKQLESVAGISEDQMQNFDLDADFDPTSHDSTMNKVFGSSYYDKKYSDSNRPAVAPDLRDELEEEYDKLEGLDDELPEGQFKYAEVYPNSYGLTVDEILYAKDTELNRWYSMKKLLREKSEMFEKREKQNYSKRAHMDPIKRKILPSLFSEEIENEWKGEEERKRKRNIKKKERKLRKLERENEIKMEKSEINVESNENNIQNKNTSSNINDAKSAHGTEPEKMKDLAGGETGSECKGKEDKKRKRNFKKRERKLRKLERESEIKVKRNEKNPKDGIVKAQNNETTVKNNALNVKISQIKTENSEIKNRKFKKEKNNTQENVLSNVSDARLEAYGRNPKKVRRFVKHFRVTSYRHFYQ